MRRDGKGDSGNIFFSPQPSQCQTIPVLRRFSKVKLPTTLGVKSAMMGIAAMGGHITNNGPPGWIVLGRGYDKLMTLEMAWVAAKQGCDQ